MKPTTDPIIHAAVDAALDLDRMQEQVAAARLVLVRLLQDVVEAEARLGGTQAAQLVEANEALVVAVMQGQIDAETSSASLAEAARTAGVDDLTQLPGRVLMQDRLATSITHARRHGGRLALLFLDLDDFKPVNDELGHSMGDAVLQRVARCLLGVVRESDTVCRYGGDEFVIVLTEVTHSADATVIAQKVQAALAVPAAAGEALPRPTASIGISLFPEDGDSVEALIACADAAMYDAKRSGPGHWAFHTRAAHPGGDPAGLPHGAPRRPAAQALPDSAARDHRYAELREANEQLVLAALGAQELQAAAELAQRRQAEIMAVMADELRSPLAPISIAAAMLGRSSADQQLLPRAQAIIEQQVSSMSRLLGEASSVAPASTASLVPDLGELDARRIVGAAADAWRPVLEGRHQRFKVRLPDRTCQVRADPKRLTQIVGNLLDNASRFTQEHGAIVLVLAVHGPDLVLTVSDNGVGIDARALPELFEPFGQTANAAGLTHAGQGIGLTAVRVLVEAHGGEIVARSAGVGLGSQFVVTLPLLRHASGV